jgi:hypothetical protein
MRSPAGPTPRRVAVALLAGALAVPLGASDAQLSQPRIDPQLALQLVSAQSGMCLDVRDGPGVGSNGTPVRQWSCDVVPNQYWRFIAASAGHYNVISAYSGKCLTVAGGEKESLDDGAPVQQSECTTADNQQWRLAVTAAKGATVDFSLNFSVQLIAKHSGKALGTRGAKSGEPAMQRDSSRAPSLVWRFAIHEAPPRPVERACFRVVLTGFTANHQTADHVLQADGKGDEVYVASEAWFFGEGGRLVGRQQRKTPVLGDVNNQPGRVQAGSLSEAGGIGTGNSVPSLEPSRLQGEPQLARLPLLLWQGELVDHQSTVVIVPTIWEWDSGAGELPRAWGDYVRAQLALGRQVVAAPQAVREPPLQQLAPFRLTTRDGDRPIGFNRPAAGDADQQLVIRPQALVLDYRVATWAAGRPVQVRYSEPNQDVLDGDYTLFLAIERTGACAP